jgi:ABC-2 type transport system permease protein
VFQRILALAKKEFLSILKDKKSRFTIIVPPLVQLLVFGYAATYDLNDVPYALYDEDGGAAARELAARLSGTPHFRQVARITRESEIEPLVDRRAVLLVLHIGPEFSRKLHTGGGAPVQVIVDGRNSNTAMIALGYVRQIVTRFNLEWAAEHGGGGPPAVLKTRSWFNPNLESRWFIVPGIIGLLTQVVTLLVTALSVAREREQGTFDQLLVTPYRPVEILIGKAAPGMFIGTFEATVILLLAVFWFQVPLVGSVVTLYIGLLLFLLSAVGVGLMVSALAVTQQQGLLGAFLYLVPSIILSGFTTPIANMPMIVQKLTLLNPLRYFMVVIREVFLKGTPTVQLIDQFWPMAVIGLVTLVAASWLFRHRIA